MHTGRAAEIRQREHTDNSKNASWARFAPSEMHSKMRPLLAMPAGSCAGLTRFKCNHGILSRGMAMQVWRSSLYAVIMYIYVQYRSGDTQQEFSYILLCCLCTENQLRIVATRVRDETQHKPAFESWF